jgi:hypothetical protein
MYANTYIENVLTLYVDPVEISLKLSTLGVSSQMQLSAETYVDGFPLPNSLPGDLRHEAHSDLLLRVHSVRSDFISYLETIAIDNSVHSNPRRQIMSFFGGATKLQFSFEIQEQRSFLLK